MASSTTKTQQQILMEVQDEANAALRVNVAAGGVGDGSILDGVTSGIKATVLDYTNANPLAVRLTDTNGDYVTAAGGTQYNDGAARGSATGMLVLVDDGTNLQSWAGDTSGRGIVTVGTALPAGTNNIGDVDVLTIAAGDNNIGNVDIVTVPAPLSTTGGGTEATALRVTVASDSTGVLSVDDNGGALTVDGTVSVNLNAGTNTNEVVGDAAHGAAVAGNPVLVGIEGRSTEPTAVDDGDVVRPLASLLGKRVSLPYAIPGSTWSYAAESGGITDTTARTIKAAAGAGVRNYVRSLQSVNAHATVSTEVAIRDGAAGTVLWRSWLRANGSNVMVVNFEPPLRGSANTLLEVVCITTGTATYINAQGFSAAE